MRDYKSLSHTRWDCKYHIVFIPKKRRKLIFGVIRKHLGEVKILEKYWDTQKLLIKPHLFTMVK